MKYFYWSYKTDEGKCVNRCTPSLYVAHSATYGNCNYLAVNVHSFTICIWHDSNLNGQCSLWLEDGQQTDKEEYAVKQKLCTNNVS